MTKGKTWQALLGLVAVTFLFYLFTLCSTVYWGDSAEFTSVAKVMGIPHPTGYPLYCLLGKLFTLIPFGNFAWRLNLLSAVASALAAAAAFLMIRETFKIAGDSTAAVAAWVAAGCFALTNKFWSQAIIAEVYALHLLLLGILMLVFFRWWNRPNPKDEYAIGFVSGLSLAHHVQSAIVIFVVGIFVLLRRTGPSSSSPPQDATRTMPERLSRILRIIGATLPGLALYLYLPIRSRMNPAIDWGDPENLPNFLWMVTGGQFKIFMWQGLTGKYDTGLYWSRGLLFYSRHFWNQWHWLGVLIPFGIWRLGRKNPSALLFLLLCFVLLTFHALNYQVGDLDVYFIPTYFIAAVFVAHGLHLLLTALEKKADPKYSGTLLAVCCLLPFALVGLNFTQVSLRGFTAVEDYGRSVFAEIREPAVIVTHSDNDIYSLWHQKYVKGQGSDTIIAGSNFVSSSWYGPMLQQEGIHAEFSSEIPETYEEWARIAYNKIIRPVERERNLYFTKPIPWSRLDLVWSKGNLPGITYDPLWVFTMLPAGVYMDRRRVSVDPEMVPEYYIQYLPPSSICRFLPVERPYTLDRTNLELGIWASPGATR